MGATAEEVHDADFRRYFAESATDSVKVVRELPPTSEEALLFAGSFSVRESELNALVSELRSLGLRWIGSREVADGDEGVGLHLGLVPHRKFERL